MQKLAVLAAVLALPVLGRAEMWKWHDVAGRPVYSNVKDRVPTDAVEVAGEIGFIGGEVEQPEEPAAKAEVPPAATPAAGSWTRATKLGPSAPCMAPFPAWLIAQWQWPEYQVDDPIGTELWLYGAEARLQLRRWGLGS